MIQQLKNSAAAIVTEGTLGYGLGYAVAASNPFITAGLAASIALVRQVTNALLKSYINNDQLTFKANSDFYKKKITLLKGAKFSLDTTFGAVIYVGVTVGLLAMKFKSMPFIDMIALSKLTHYGRKLAGAAYFHLHYLIAR